MWGFYSLTASETVNLVGFSLYGHANGDPTPVDVVVRLVSSDEETTFYEFETHEELPEQGGEFEVQLPEPFTIRAMDGYTFIVSVNVSYLWLMNNQPHSTFKCKYLFSC